MTLTHDEEHLVGWAWEQPNLCQRSCLFLSQLLWQRAHAGVKPKNVGLCFHQLDCQISSRALEFERHFLAEGKPVNFFPEVLNSDLSASGMPPAQHYWLLRELKQTFPIVQADPRRISQRTWHLALFSRYICSSQQKSHPLFLPSLTRINGPLQSHTACLCQVLHCTKMPYKLQMESTSSRVICSTSPYTQTMLVSVRTVEFGLPNHGAHIPQGAGGSSHSNVMNHAQGLAPAVSPPSRAAQQQERKDEDAESRAEIATSYVRALWITEQFV